MPTRRESLTRRFAPKHRFQRAGLLLLVFSALLGVADPGLSATIEAVYNSASEIPFSTQDQYSASGKTVAFALNFEPQAGTELTVVRNIGPGFIRGRFTGLEHGQEISLSYAGTDYPFVANYYGGLFGRDLVLVWAKNHLFSWGKRDMLGGITGRDLPVEVEAPWWGPLAGKTVIKVANGLNHSLALLSDGTVAAWGANSDGQLGNGTLSNSFHPIQVEDRAEKNSALYGKTVVDIAAGVHHSLALCSDGSVVAWGRNTHGQLGMRRTPLGAVIMVPSRVINIITGHQMSGKLIVDIAAGAYHSMALAEDGTLGAWGKNDAGQIGDGTQTNRDLPTAVNRDPSRSTLAGRTIMDIAAGTGHSLAICSDGSIHSWGANSHGQLGQSDPVTTSTSSSTSYSGGPSQFWNNDTVQGVSSGIDTYNGVLNNDFVNTIMTGFDMDFPAPIPNVLSLGQFVDSAANPIRQETTITTSYTTANWREYPGFIMLSNALFGKLPIAVRAGWRHTLILFSDGTVASWGDNSYGQLGSGNRGQRRAPAPVITTEGVSALFGKRAVKLGSGRSFSSVICSDGTAAAWGQNEMGQLGDDSTEDRLVPTAVGMSTLANGERFVAISGGPDSLHSVAIVATPLEGRIEVYGEDSEIWNGSSWARRYDGTDFGESDADTPVVHTFEIRNLGSGALTLSGAPRVAVSGAQAGDFTIIRQPQSPVPSNDGRVTFDLQFLPLGSGSREATLTIENNDSTESPFTFIVQGDGEYADMKMSGNGNPIHYGSSYPTTANNTDFGLSLPTNPVVKSFLIENPGGGLLNLTGAPPVQVSGPHAGDFTVTTQPVTPVDNGGSETFEITFSASRPGLREAMVTIGNDTRWKDPFSFAIKGTGPEPEMKILGLGRVIAKGDTSPSSLDHTDFGYTSVGLPLTNDFWVLNNGVGSLHLTGTPAVVLSGPGAGDFFVTNGPASVVAHDGGTSLFSIVYAPSVIGSTSTATVHIASDDADMNPYTFTIKGYAAEPDMEVLGGGLLIVDGDNSPAYADDTDFGDSPVGVSVTNIYTVRNAGAGRLNLSGNPRVVISGVDAGNFVLAQDAASFVDPDGGNSDFTIVFTPTTENKISHAMVSVTSDDRNHSTYAFHIRGSGPVPTMSVLGNGEEIESGSAQAETNNGTFFGSTLLGTTLTNTFTLFNNGLASLNLTGSPAVIISGADAADFAVTEQPSGPVAAGGNSTKFSIRYTPSQIGKVSTALVSIANDDALRTPYTFTIQGIGPEPITRIEGAGVVISNGAAPRSLDGTDFGTTPLGVAVTNRFTVFNDGLLALQLSGTPVVTLSGPDAGDFALALDASPTVDPSGNTVFDLAFTPSVVGKRSQATVTLVSDDVKRSPFSFAIQGFGPVPVMSIQGNGQPIPSGSTEAISGNATDFGSASSRMALTNRFTIINDGLSTLNLTGTPVVVVSGADAADFRVSLLPSTTVAFGGGTTVFDVAYAPMEPGKTSTALISIDHDDRERTPYTFTVSGQTPEPAISVWGNGVSLVDGSDQASVLNNTDFGASSVGVPVAQSFSVQNDGVGHLWLTGTPVVAIAGAHPEDFSVSQLPASPVSPSGGTAVFEITFTPTVVGRSSIGLVSIASDDLDQTPFTFAVEGQALIPDIAVSGAGFTIPAGDTTPSRTDNSDFGVAGFSAAVTNAFVVSNSGIGRLRLSGSPRVALTGPTAADFSVVQDADATVASGTNSTFLIAFTPSANGLRSATVTLSSDDPDTPSYSFTIQGQGPAPTYNLREHDPVIQIDLREFFNDPTGALTYAIKTVSHGSSTSHGVRDHFLMVAPADVYEVYESNVITIGATDGVTENTIPFLFNIQQVNDAPILTFYYATNDAPVSVYPGSSDNWYHSVASSYDGDILLAGGISGREGYVFVSKDGGESWVPRITDQSRTWGSLACSSNGIRMAASSGSVYISDDSGSTWQMRLNVAGKSCVDVEMTLDGSTLFAALIPVSGQGSLIMKSTDGGATWTQKYQIAGRLSAVACSDDGQTIVATEARGPYDGTSYWNGGHLHVSRDGGNTWTPCMTDVYRAWWDVDCSSDGRRWVASVRGEHVYTSADGGITWTGHKMEANQLWMGVVCSADGMTMAASSMTGNQIQMSYDSGATWQRWYHHAGASVSGTFVSFTDQERSLIAGASGGAGPLKIFPTVSSFEPVARGLMNTPTYVFSFVSSEKGNKDTDDTVSYIVENDNPGLFTQQPVIDSNRRLFFEPVPGQIGTAYATVTAVDDQGTANGGSDTSRTWPFRIEVNPAANVPPTVTFATNTIRRAQGETAFTNGTGFATFDRGAASESSQALKQYIVSSDAPGLFSAPPRLDLQGNLTFALDPLARGEAKVSVLVQDTGGTLYGGSDMGSNSFTIVVHSVNKAPSAAFASAWVTAPVNAPEQHLFDFATFSPGPIADDWQELVGYTLTVDEPALFSRVPSLDVDGTLRFTPAPDALGTAIVSVVVQDNGGTANGGVDVHTNSFGIELVGGSNLLYVVTTSSDSGPGSLRQAILDANQAGQPVTILFLNNLGTLQPVSALPVITNAVTVNGGLGNDLAGTLAVGSGGALGLKLSTLPGGDVTLQDGGRFSSDGEVAGDLTLADGGRLSPGSGSGNAPGIVVADNAVWEGGGSYEWGINDAAGSPGQISDILILRGGLTLDSSATSSNPFTIKINSFSSAGDAPGPLANFDPDQAFTWPLVSCGQEPDPNVPGSGARINGFQDASGFRLDLSAFTNHNETLGGTFALVMQGDALLLTFSPNLTPLAFDDVYLMDEGGSLITGYTNGVMANDFDPYLDPISAMQLGGATNGGAVSLNGDGSFTYTPSSPAFTGADGFAYAVTDGIRTSETATVTIHVLPPNQPPIFSLPALANFTEDCGAVVVSNFAYGISAGSAVEDAAGQAVSFVVSNDNSGLFLTSPSLDAEGTLSFSPAEDAYGTSTVWVTAHDNGGTNNGGVAVSVPKHFDLVLYPVNDAPSAGFAANPLQVLKTGSAVISNAFATFVAGPANESWQSLTGYTVTTDAPILFAVPPAIDLAGTLTFTPLDANTTGSVQVTVTVQDNGGTDLGGQDAGTNTFTLALMDANTPPDFTFNQERLAPPGLIWTPRESNRAWSAVAVSSNGQFIAATESNGLIHVSSDGGGTWTPAGSSGYWTSVSCSWDGQRMIASAYGGQLHVSTNAGLSWAAHETSRDWQAVHASADGMTMVAAAKGGLVYLSQDGGQTWDPGDYAISSWTGLAGSADGSALIGVGSSAKQSSDGGTNWLNLTGLAAATWAGATSSADGQLLALARANGALALSMDGGVTWSDREAVRNWSAISGSASGQRMAAVVDNGMVYISLNGGSSWDASSADSNQPETNRAWKAVSFSADGRRVVAAAADGQIYTSGEPLLVADENSGYTWIPEFLTEISGGSGLESLQSVQFAVTNNHPEWFTEQPAISEDGTLSYTLASNVTGELELSVTALDDGGSLGGSNTLTQTLPMLIRSVPAITNVTAVQSSGVYKANQTLLIEVTFDEPVVVTGEPLLVMNSGAVLVNTSGSGTRTLVFEYRIRSGEVSTNLDVMVADALQLDGGSIRGFGGADANLLLPEPGEPGSLTSNRSIVVDTQRPLLVFGPPSVSMATTGPVTVAVTYVDDTFVASTLGVNHLSLIKDGNVSSTFSVDASAGSNRTVTISNISGAGRFRLWVGYGTAVDAAGNVASAGSATDWVTVNPVVTDVSSPLSDGTYYAADRIPIEITFSAAVNVLGTPALELNAGGQAVYVSGSGSDVLVFEYIPAVPETTLDLDYVSIGALQYNGGIIQSENGVLALPSLPAPGSPHSLGGQKDLAIDTSTLHASGDQVVTGEDQPLPITLRGSDPRQLPLSFEVVTGPAHGTLSGLAPSVVYTPAENFSGADSFVFSVSNGSVTSSPATVSITVTNINDAPTGIVLSPETIADGLSSWTQIATLSSEDVDIGDTHSYQLVAGVGDTDNRTFYVSGTNLTITVDTHYNIQSNYFIRLRSTDQGGSSVEKALILRVVPPPQVTTLPGDEIMATRANFRAEVNTYGGVGDVRFQYSTSTNNAYSVVTLAGTGSPGYADGPGATALFNHPYGIAVDADGNVFVADRDNHVIRKIATDGTVTTVAGAGTPGYADGQGTNALFNAPRGLTVDSSGVLYIADTLNHRIRGIDPDGLVTSIVGSGVAGYLNGTDLLSQFNHPYSIVLDESWDAMYIADSSNHCYRLRLPWGVYTAAGDGSPGYQDGVTGTKCNRPEGMVIYGGGLILADTGNQRIRYTYGEGAVASMAGTGIAGYADGANGSAQFNEPVGIAYDSEERWIYVADRANHCIRIVDVMGAGVSTFAGTNSPGFVNGPLGQARFNEPAGMVLTSQGHLIIADSRNHAIRSIVPPEPATEISAQSGFSSEGPQVVSLTMTNLLPETTYYVRALCYHAGGVAVGDFVEVTTTALNTNMVSLSIDSMYGGVSRSSIVTNWGRTLSLSVDSSPYTVGSTQYVANGAVVVSNAFTQLSSTNISITLTNDTTVSWQWTTNYWLETSNGPHGSVDVPSGWQPAGVTTAITAVADAHCLFTNWTGDVSGTNAYANPLTVTMDGPQSVTAHFVEAIGTITLGDLEQTYNGTSRQISVTTSPTGLAVNVTYDGVATVPTNAGSYTVVGVLDDGLYRGAVTGTLTVAKAPQVISFVNPGAVSTTNQTVLSATSGSGLPVSLSVLSGLATLSTNVAPATLTYGGAGQVSIVASQGGNGNWLAAAQVTNTFTVSATPQAPLIFTPSSPLTFNTTNTLSANGGSGSGSVSYAVLSGPGMITNTIGLLATSGTGAIVVQATKAADALYASQSASATVTVAKASQTISFASPGTQFWTNTVTLSASATSRGTITFAVLSGLASLTDGTNLTFSGYGSVVLTADHPGDADWQAAPTVTNTFSVTGPQLVVLGTNGAVVLSSNNVSAADGTHFGEVITSLETVTNVFSITNAGNATLTISGLATNGPQASSFSLLLTNSVISASSVIEIPVVFDPQVGGSNTATFVFSFDGTNSPYTINVAGVGLGGGIALTTNELAFTATFAGANPAAQELLLANVGVSSFTWANTIAYSGSASNWLSVLPGEGTMNIGAAAVLTNAVAATGLSAGTYTALVSIAAADATNSPQSYAVSLTVGKASQVIRFVNPGTQVMTNETSLTATSSSGLPVSLSILSGPAVLSTNVSPAVATYVAGGQVVIVASQAGNANWSSAASVTNTFTVQQRQAVYRFWSTRLRSHFFTVSEAEKDELLAKWPDVWSLEGVAFYAYAQAVDGSLPVHRFWSDRIGGHLFTMSDEEKAELESRFANAYQYEGQAWHAFDHQVPGTMPVYRFWSPSLKKLFFTISEEEKNNVIANMSGAWRYEGIAWYAYPSIEPSKTRGAPQGADYTKGMSHAALPADAMITETSPEVSFRLSYGDDVVVAAALYDPVTAEFTELLAPTLAPRELLVPAIPFGQRHWMVVTSRHLDQESETMDYGGWLGRVTEVPQEQVATIDVGDDMPLGLPVEHINLPEGQGTLSLYLYSPTGKDPIQALTGIEGGSTYELTVPAWNQWYQLDIEAERSGVLLKTLWIGHLRTH